MMTDELPGAGPELDAMVMDPSTNDYDAWLALEAWRMQHPGTDWEAGFQSGVSPVIAHYWCKIDNRFIGRGSTLPLAICHAILRATREVQS